MYADTLHGRGGAPAEPSVGCSPEHLERIARYYRNSEFDYNVIWHSNRNLARHFGFGPDGRRRGKFHDEALVLASMRLADLAGVGASTRVLDCGCGLGGTSIWIARERNARVMGIDLLEAQLQRARQEAARAKVLERTEFVVADYTATPIKGESFDVVLAQEVFAMLKRRISSIGRHTGSWRRAAR